MFSLNLSHVFGLCWILVACLATTFKPYRKISGYRCAPSFPYSGPRPVPSDRHCILWGMSHGCTVMQAGPECHCCGSVEPNSTTSILAPTANFNEPCAVNEQCTSGVCNQGHKICSFCGEGLPWPDDDASCYELLKLNTSSLPAAQDSCAAWGGIMAAPLSESHNHWIYSLAEQELTIWLGIKQISGSWFKIEDDTAVPFTGQWFPPFESYCRQVPGGHLYTGNVSTTKSGKTCQRWDVDYPHVKVSYCKNPDNFIGGNLSINENFCRNCNPDFSSLWCYTTDPGMRWENCDVPLCADLCAVMGRDRAWKLVDCDEDPTTNSIYTVCKKNKLN